MGTDRYREACAIFPCKCTCFREQRHGKDAACNSSYLYKAHSKHACIHGHVGQHLLCIISVDHFIFIATSHKATMAVLKLPVYYALAASW